LTWRTGRQQWEDQVRDGTAMLGDRNHATKLTAEQVQEIRTRYAAGGERQVDLAAEFGIKQPALSALLRRATWAHVP
jgi:predicted DNA binding protein